MKNLFAILLICFSGVVSAQDLNLNTFFGKGTTLTKQEVDDNWIQIQTTVNNTNQAWLSVSGTNTKTITVTKAGNIAWLTASFNDLDNQTITYSNDSLTISGGNKVKVTLTERIFSSNGTTATTYTLPFPPVSTKHLQVYLNSALVDSGDINLNTNQVQLLFPIETSDFIKIYYKTTQ